MAIYLDSSALVKLVVEEEESSALRQFLVAQNGPFLSSAIARVEVPRAARRHGAEDRGRDVVARLDAIEIHGQILDEAAAVGPATLTSLDALHLASAVFAGERLEHFVAYDARLVDAARSAGFDVQTPA